MQSLMLHNILVRKKSILDQFRGGLSAIIADNPPIIVLIDCFVHKEEVNNESVASCLHFATTENEGAERVFQMLNTFIQNSSPDDLDDFLRFVSDSRSSATCTLPKRITVFFASTSTCLLNLKLPNHCNSYKDF